MLISRHLKPYFKNRSNIVILAVLIIAVGFGAFTRLSGLHILSLWWDDGQTYLGTLGILENGYPLLPSGNIMYHTIFSFYLRAIPALISGLNEAALRIPSAFFGILIIPLMFLFGKTLANKYAGILAAVIATLNLWMVEFSREARYYSEFQFFYLLSAYFFYLGFFKDRNRFRIPSLVLIVITSLITHQGFTLIFLFIPLFIFKGYRRFFKKDIVIPFAVTAFLILVQLLQRILFWDVGINIYETSVQSSNPIIRLIGKFITGVLPDPFFIRIFGEMFPKMFFVFNLGLILMLLYIFINRIRNSNEAWKNIYVKNRIDLKLPYNLFFIYFMFYSNLYFIGIGPMNPQQRYIFYLFPFMILGYSYVIFDLGRLMSLLIAKTRPPKSQGKRFRILKYIIYLIVPLIILLFTLNYINPVHSLKITKRSDGDRVNMLFSPSNIAKIHYDFKDPGAFVYNNKEDGDLVISTELLNMFPYTKQFDYWLWSSEEVAWRPYDKIENTYYDKYFGAVLIRDAVQLIDLLNEKQDRNIWLIATYSINDTSHINPELSNFILGKSGLIVFEGADDQTKVFYFPKDDTGTRAYNFTASIEPAEDEILEFDKENDILSLDLSKAANSGYLKYGWSVAESHGTWSTSRESSLFINFYEKTDYRITMDVKPLYIPDTQQAVKLYFNQELIGETVLEGPEYTTISFEIPGSLIELDDFNSLSFHFNYVSTPFDLGIGTDSRTLSVSFKYLEIEKE